MASEQYPLSASVQEWCQEHNIMMVDACGDAEGPHSAFFETRAVHELCSTVLRQEGSDPDLCDFAEKVAELEVRILLSHALEKAGFSVDRSMVIIGDTTTTIADGPPHIDTDMALTAIRRVSSTHLGNFQNSGSVILRRMVEPFTHCNALSAAAGIACRLLECPASRLLPDKSLMDESGEDGIEILVALDSATGVQVGSDNIDHAQGDVLARRLSSAEYVAASETATVSFRLEKVAASHDTATFVNSLFGSRGETPTSVVQLSKGTIF